LFKTQQKFPKARGTFQKKKEKRNEANAPADGVVVGISIDQAIGRF
jgi:hypothetical protein